MQAQQTAPLEIARTILAPETIREIRQMGFSHSAYNIIDRWALNSPEKLKSLEQQGSMKFMIALNYQYQAETQILNSESARQARFHGMSDFEILTTAEVDTELHLNCIC